MKDRKEKPVPVYACAAIEGAHEVTRNDRPLMTPKGAPFHVPTQRLAEKIVQEWQAQTDKIKPDTMPMTQLTATALDLVGKDKAKTVGGLLAYLGSELLCHRVETPSSLVQKQATLWQPIVDWAQARYDVAFVLGSGIMPIRQHEETLERFSGVLNSLDDFHLAGLSHATDVAGSLLLGLALMEKHTSAQDVFVASELDFTHQAATWGDDPVTQARQSSVLADLQNCETWFGVLEG